jgi:hypothetical protein
MRHFFPVLLWTAVFLLILLALDQLLVRVPASAPAHVVVATFYRDLRGRVLDLAKGALATPAPASAPAKGSPSVTPPKGAPGSVEAIIEQQQAQPLPAANAAPRPPVAKEPKPRYVYADSRGELHFAETLAEIPEQYRTKAKVLGE